MVSFLQESGLLLGLSLTQLRIHRWPLLAPSEQVRHITSSSLYFLFSPCTNVFPRSHSRLCNCPQERWSRLPVDRLCVDGLGCVRGHGGTRRDGHILAAQKVLLRLRDPLRRPGRGICHWMELLSQIRHRPTKQPHSHGYPHQVLGSQHQRGSLDYCLWRADHRVECKPRASPSLVRPRLAKEHAKANRPNQCPNSSSMSSSSARQSSGCL